MRAHINIIETSGAPRAAPHRKDFSMKLFIIAAATALISTTAIAAGSNGQSTPTGTAGEGYIYGGFGPYNDSR